MSHRRLIAKGLALAFLFGLLFWLVDALLQRYYFAEHLRVMMFEPPETLLDALILQISPRVAFVRLSFLAACLLGGLIAALYVRQQRISREQHRSYVTGSPIAIFVADREGRYVRANPAACAMTFSRFSE